MSSPHLQPSARTYRAAGIVGAAVLAVTLAGCASSTDAATPSTTATSTARTTPGPNGPTSDHTPTAPSTAAAAPATAPSGVTVEVRIAGGRVEPKLQNVKVSVGQAVTIRGVSDATESLHVHGYDKTLNLPANSPASLRFNANVKGVFEVETHQTGQLVAKLVVS
jgi:hypothetical protein